MSMMMPNGIDSFFSSNKGVPANDGQPQEAPVGFLGGLMVAAVSLSRQQLITLLAAALPIVLYVLYQTFLKRQRKRKPDMTNMDIRELISCGTYFDRTYAVWKPKKGNFRDQATANSITNLLGRRTMSFYKETCNSCDTCQEPGKVRIYSASRAKSDCKLLIDPSRMAWGSARSNVNLFGTQVLCSLAHIIPADVGCSIFHGPMGDLVAGKGIKSNTAQGRFLKVHGTENDSTNRGMKNIPQNFLPLPENHGDFFDGQNAGKLIIVPIMEWNEGKINWDEGQDYHLLVVGKDRATYRWMYGADNLQENEENDISHGDIEEATDGEIDRATAFLEGCVKVLAKQLDGGENGPLQDSQARGLQSIPHTFPDYDEVGVEVGLGQAKETISVDFSFSVESESVIPEEETTQKRAAEKAETKAQISKNYQKLKDVKAALNNGEVWVPEFKGKNIRVMKVRLGHFYEVMNGTKGLQFLPDPLLVGLRAAMNWSTYMNQQLLPASRQQPMKTQSIYVESDEESVPWELDPVYGLSVGLGVSAVEVPDDDISESSDLSEQTPPIAEDKVAVVTPPGMVEADVAVVTPPGLVDANAGVAATCTP